MNAAARHALVAALAILLTATPGSAPAQGQGNPRGLSMRAPDRDEDFRRADASAVVAAELAFARAAQDKGQWTAFAEYATDDAVMFVPEVVNAKAWLKGRANPPQAVRWQPHQVWSSCDGSLAVTKGAWQRPDGSVGYFTTVWRRPEGREAEYRWVMDQGDVLQEPLAAPEMIDAKAADCSDVMASAVYLENGRDADGFHAVSGVSADESLSWSVVVAPDASRTLTVHFWQDGELKEVLRSEVAAE